MTFRYEFETMNDSDYNMKLHYSTDSWTMKKLFDLSKSKLTKKYGVDVKGNPDLLEHFTIEEKYQKVFFPVVYKGVLRHVKKVMKEVKKDGITCLNSSVFEVEYAKESPNKWRMVVVIGGQYDYKK